jgi:hypothetical protein
MIYFTTFILALLLSHIACAAPTCDDVFAPDDAIMYADAQQGQHTLLKPPVIKPPKPTKPTPTKAPPKPTKPPPTKAPPKPTPPPKTTNAPPKPTAPPKPPPVVLYDVTWAPKYGNRSGITKSATCSNLARQYPHFGNFPHFPYIGGAWNVTSSSSKACGTCVNLTDTKTHRTIFITVMDKAKTTKPGWYNISQVAFTALNGGKPGTVLQASAKEVNSRFCHLLG